MKSDFLSGVFSVMNKAAMNIHTQVFPMSNVFISPGKYLKGHLLGLRVCAYLTLWKTARPIFRVVAQSPIPASHRWAFSFLHPCQQAVLSVVASHCGFCLHLLDDQGAEHIFHVLIGIVSFVKCLFQSFTQFICFFNLIVM